MKDYSDMTEDELRRSFLANGSNFFGWNAGKNTPNILAQMTEGVSLLNQNINRSNESSQKLASALNKLTLAAVVVGGLTLIATASGVVLQICK